MFPVEYDERAFLSLRAFLLGHLKVLLANLIIKMDKKKHFNPANYFS
jgi:hypothetical protein